MNQSHISRVLMLVAIAVMSTSSGLFAVNAPYVDSRTIKERFGEVTTQEMAMLRQKRVLLMSRSFGMNLHKGMRLISAKDVRYSFPTLYQRYDLFKSGGDLSVIPGDAMQKNTFVHALCTIEPYTKRIDEAAHLLGDAPFKFSELVDVVMIEYHECKPDAFDGYASKMDALRAAFPKVHFIYVTAAFAGPQFAKMNETSHAFSEKVRARYKGIVPLMDWSAILSDDFRVGRMFCPEYSKDPIGLHPDSDEGQTMLAKGFLLLLNDIYKLYKPGSNVLPGGKVLVKASSKQPIVEAPTETIPADHPEYRAVRAILDANGLIARKVEAGMVVKGGHVVELYLQEGGVTELPDAIGVLTELRLLHVYGDRNLAHPLLKRISPEIGKCTKLEELLLNSNELSELPADIVKLDNLRLMSLADNHLRSVSAEIAAWAKKYDPQGYVNKQSQPPK